MTLKEAIESGKPFRLKGDTRWYTKAEWYTFAISDVLSEDWETQMEKEFTHEDLTRALETVKMYVNPHDGWSWNEIKEIATEAAKFNNL